jgi:zinc protease
MTLYMIGDIDIETATVAAERAFGKWTHKHRSARQAIGKAQDGTARVILVDQPGAESSTIVAGHALPPFDPATSTELSILNAVFGGNFESRLNMNLREDKGWSYGYRSGIQSNYSGDQLLVMRGQVQTDKTAASMQEIQREFTEFASTRPASKTEVDRLKINRIRSLPGSFSTNRGFLSSIVASDSFGLPFDYAEGRAERISAVTVDGVTATARQLMRTEILTWVVVGDLLKIEETVRALGYGDVEVWDAFGNRLR